MTETLQEQVLDLRGSGLTQVQVAEKLGISQQYVSKLERSAESSNDEADESGTTDEVPQGTTGVPQSTDETTDESSTPTQDTQDDFVCDKCGGRDYYDADEYLAAYGNGLENNHIALLLKAESVCATCGKTH
jgi:transcriptional regulator with XRE-family HTH domain